MGCNGFLLLLRQAVKPRKISQKNCQNVRIVHGDHLARQCAQGDVQVFCNVEGGVELGVSVLQNIL